MFEIGEAMGDPDVFEARAEIRPTNFAPVIRALADGVRTLSMLRWGLVPHWARDTKIASKCINARSETAPERPAFRDAVRARRCIIPATGFWEWKDVGLKKKVKYEVRPSGPSGSIVAECFALAGLWARWQPPDGGPELLTFSLLTTEANTTMSALHDRMPVLLPPEAFELWLDPNQRDLGPLARFLVPSPPDWLTVRLAEVDG